MNDNDLKDQVLAQREHYELLFAIAQGDVEPTAEQCEHLGIDVDSDDIESAALGALHESVLDFEVHGKRSPGGEWEMTHVEMIVCIGGPHVELNTQLRCWVGCWGGETFRVSASTDLCEWVECLVDY